MLTKEKGAADGGSVGHHNHCGKPCELSSGNRNCHHKDYIFTHEVNVISEMSALTIAAQFTPAKTCDPSQPLTSFFMFAKELKHNTCHCGHSWWKFHTPP